MFKSLFKTTVRKLIKDRLYTGINVFGLAVGFGLFLVIALYVQRELSTDQQHEDYELIYRVNTDVTSEEGVTSHYALGYQPMAQSLVDEFPAVEAATIFYSPAAQFSFRAIDELISVENSNIFFTTNGFFDIFEHDWLREGKRLTEPNTVVLSSELAKRFFGQGEAMGQTLTYETGGRKFILEVTGIFEKSTKPSHLAYDMLISYESDINFWKAMVERNSGYMYVYAYFKANQQLPLVDWNAALATWKTQYPNVGSSRDFTVQPLTDIYWNPRELEPGSTGNMAYIYIFGAFGLTVIVLAIVNFVNLMTARSIRRSKEAAVRKIVGASRRGLIGQFLMEATLLSAFAMLFGGVLAERLITPINSGLGLELSFDIFGNASLALTVLLLPLAVGLLSGMYPAFIISAIRPFSLLGGRLKWSISHHYLRNGLLALQFLISVLVISGVLIISRQMDYIKAEGLGFQEDPVIVLPRISNNSNYLIRQEVAANPDVKAMASLTSIPGYRVPRARQIKEAGTAGEGIQANGIWVSLDYASIMELEFTKGRDFEETDRENTLIINETAARALGWQDYEAIGKSLVIMERNGFGSTPYEIVGVIEDFHYQSMYEEVAPLFLKNDEHSRRGGAASIVQLSQQNLDETLAYLASTWSEIEQTEAFDYYFLDDAVSEEYEKEVKLSKTVKYVSAISIIVCLLGLFGLVSLNLESRRKEIGIRKVLGATIARIGLLFAQKYVGIIVISVAVGLPISYYLLNLWLANFKYSIDYSMLTYCLVGAGLLLVSLSLVGIQSASASQTNPVDSLRDE